MIDIHCHILPNLDDGAIDMDMSIRMIKSARKTGTTKMIATPHFAPEYGFDHAYGSFLKERYEELKYTLEMELVDTEIYLGQEIMYSPEVPHLLKDGKLISLNSSRYILLEFPFDTSTIDILEAVDEITAIGYIPIIAHPERYDEVRFEPYLAEELIESGAVCQLNGGSLTGFFGESVKRTANFLLKKGWAGVIASDCHRDRIRTSDLLQTWEYINEVYGEETADLLFRINPEKILEDKTI